MPETITATNYACRDCGAEWYSEDGHEPCTECRSWDVAAIETVTVIA